MFFLLGLFKTGDRNEKFWMSTGKLGDRKKETKRNGPKRNEINQNETTEQQSPVRSQIYFVIFVTKNMGHPCPGYIIILILNA